MCHHNLLGSARKYYLCCMSMSCLSRLERVEVMQSIFHFSSQISGTNFDRIPRPKYSLYSYTPYGPHVAPPLLPSLPPVHNMSER